VLKKQDPAFLKKYDLSKLRALLRRRADGRDLPPVDDGRAGHPVIDHYWQTETGWAMLSLMPGVEKQDVQLGSPGFPVWLRRASVP
jgi:propionyl-CoA synthetase